MSDRPPPLGSEWPQVWTMVFTAAPSEVPPRSRVNRLLKCALALGLKCEAVRYPNWEELSAIDEDDTEE